MGKKINWKIILKFRKNYLQEKLFRRHFRPCSCSVPLRLHPIFARTFQSLVSIPPWKGNHRHWGPSLWMRSSIRGPWRCWWVASLSRNEGISVITLSVQRKYDNSRRKQQYYVSKSQFFLSSLARKFKVVAHGDKRVKISRKVSNLNFVLKIETFFPDFLMEYLNFDRLWSIIFVDCFQRFSYC